MSTISRALAGSSVLAVVAATMTFAAAPAYAATAAYASPTGMGDCSSAAQACSLTSAVADLTSGGTIIVEDGRYPAVSLTLDSPFTFQAAPGAYPVFAGNGSNDVIKAVDVDVTVDGLTLTGGANAINESSAGTDTTAIVSVSNSNLSGNSGAGIEDDISLGTVTVTDSNLSSNDYGLTAESVASVTVSDSTVIKDSFDGLNADATTMTVTSTTVVDDDLGLNATTLKTGADIVAGNTFEGCFKAATTDEGYDLSSDTSCGFTGSGSHAGLGDALTNSVGSPADNGGPTQTAALAAGSTAIDAVTGSLSDSTAVCGTRDQRGFLRPAAPCDAGAYETAPTSDDPTCTPGAVTTGISTSVTFCYLDAPQSWVVPPVATSISADVSGAAGGGSLNAPPLPPLAGGLGGAAVADLTGLTAGQPVAVNVGGVGGGTCLNHAGGFNGGGAGDQIATCADNAAENSGGGGGGSDLRVGGDALADRILVAGGGGGAGGLTAGGAGGGTTGGTGAPNAGDQCGGAGGNQDGTAGSGQTGVGDPGNGASGNNGAGGGGFYGGASGGDPTNSFCGGGGGSGYFDPAQTSGGQLTSGVRSGDGIVTITYLTPISTMSAVSAVPTSSVFGQSVTFSDAISPTPDGGTVQWKVGGTDSGAALPVSGSTKLTLSSLPVGSDSVEGDYSGDTSYVESSNSTMFVVSKASTTTAVAVGVNELGALVSVVSPGAGTPTGTVTFAVDGTRVGTAPVCANGAAVLKRTTVGAHGVTATYSGDGSFLGSSGSTATNNPTIVAHVSSGHAKTAVGWYRSPVKVSFTCTTAGSALIGGCPKPVTLSKNGAAQSVTKTIVASNGGIATVTVSPINIDQTLPTVRISGVKAGATYGAFPAPTVKCVAHDSLSGLAKACTVSTQHSGSDVTYTATAKDKAGNATSKTALIKLLNYFVVGVTPTSDQFTVHVGKSYLVGAKVATSKPPVYEQAAPSGSVPHPDRPVMTRVGSGKWETRIHITARMSHSTDWVVGVKVGHHSHLIQLRVIG